MNKQNLSEQDSNDTLVFTIKKSSQKILIGKLIILVALSITLGNFLTQDPIDRYYKGRELIKEEYIKNYDKYKADLLSSGGLKNQIFSN